MQRHPLTHEPGPKQVLLTQKDWQVAVDAGLRTSAAMVAAMSRIMF